LEEKENDICDPMPISNAAIKVTTQGEHIVIGKLLKGNFSDTLQIITLFSGQS
jgi:hypothetical protein